MSPWTEARPTSLSDLPVRLGPLTWAQRAMWDTYQRLAAPDRHHLTVVKSAALPSRLGVERVLRRLEALGARHEVLRTVYRTDANGEPEQAVRTHAGPVVQEREVADTSLADAVTRVERAEGSRAFDITVDDPLRVTFVRGTDGGRYLVLASHHLAMDGWSITRLAESLTREEEPGPLEPDVCRQPLDHAADEARLVRDGHVAATEAYWEQQLRTVPQSMFTLGGEPARPRYRTLTLESAALAMTLPVAAARYRVTTSTVLLSTVVAVLSRLTRQDTCALQVTSANRDAPELLGALGNYFQNVLLSVPVLGATTFGELVVRSGAAAHLAYEHSHYDPVVVARRIRRVNAERGIALDRTCIVNDERAVTTNPARGRRRPDGAALTRALERSRLEWLPRRHHDRGPKCQVWVNDGPGTDGGSGGPEVIHLTLQSDTAYLPPSGMEVFLRDIERLVAAVCPADLPLAELDDVVLSRPAPGVRGLRRVDDCLVDVDGVARLVRSAVPGAEAAVFLEPGPDRTGRLVAYLAAGDRPHTPAAVHRACLAALRATPERHALMTPQQYVLCSAAPPRGSDATAWRALAREAGTGRARD
ncbi:condensation domain-containing protein [Streptomyces sp. NBS 14/10]|uniref:condensation domain-containing protein n=1 Tax=Streptomyces sp. NBS 14/10 TaxID=1945643 RepID=UPI000B7E0FB3|nr:condensation domain-containing protein [Streptomyces sp. NBS 14/10]KAK1177245.1 condensation domain-containing protein [Streptomyces sp. NBS 14/10]